MTLERLFPVSGFDLPEAGFWLNFESLVIVLHSIVAHLSDTYCHHPRMILLGIIPGNEKAPPPENRRWCQKSLTAASTFWSVWPNRAVMQKANGQYSQTNKKDRH